MLPTLHILGLTIPMYGVMTAVGMLAALLLLFKTSKYVRFTEDQILSAALWAIICGFLGAKPIKLPIPIEGSSTMPPL